MKGAESSWRNDASAAVHVRKEPEDPSTTGL